MAATAYRSVPRVGAPRVRAAAAVPANGPKIAPNGRPYDVRFVASTERLAMDGGVILSNAWDLTRFMQRPRFLEMHDLHAANGLTRTVLGSVVHAGVETDVPTAIAGPTGRALVEYVRFAGTPYAQEVKSLYDDGHLSDCSVRWDPRTERTRAPSAQETARYGEGVQWIATRAEQLELSAVILGADPGAMELAGAGVDSSMNPRVMAAFARARAAGRRLPLLEKRIVETVRRRRRGIDSSAAQSVVADLSTSMDALDALLAAIGTVRQQIVDNVALLRDCMASAVEADVNGRGDWNELSEKLLEEIGLRIALEEIGLRLGNN
ncbi:MAG TPA: hypothetical protein VJU87_10790 [Gemmatimonadaceae bacterium]|nr:hypothetical protein [Gemmatimonadaceae bacterium]